MSNKTLVGAGNDSFDVSLMARIDINALLALLIRKGVFTEQEWIDALQAEAEQYDRDLEKRFPGVRATDQGLQFYDVQKMRPWIKDWKP